MRKIKFKAWDMICKTWFTINSFEPPDNKLSTLIKYVEDSNAKGLKMELIQYTGSKDKNGTEIYEGDLIKDDRIDEDNIYEVEWGLLGWYVDGLEGEYFQMVTRHLEIIGNIYESKK